MEKEKSIIPSVANLLLSNFFCQIESPCSTVKTQESGRVFISRKPFFPLLSENGLLVLNDDFKTHQKFIFLHWLFILP